MEKLPPRSLLLRPEPLGIETGGIESLRSWIFSALTLRDDLSSLTIDAWENVVAKVGFRTEVQKWCPLCLKDDPFERLVWTLAPVESCLVHHVRLVQVCSSCHSPAFQSATQPSWRECPFCGNCRCSDPVGGSTDEQDWTSRQIATLVKAQQKGWIPDQNRISRVWKQLFLPHFSSSSEACKFFGFREDIFRPRTKSKTGIPSIVTLLRLCKCSALDLDGLLTEDFAKLRPRLRKAQTLLRRERLSRAEVIRRVEKVLSEANSNVLTFRLLDKKVGISKKVLYRRYPRLHARILAHFRQRRQEKKREMRTIRLEKAVQFIWQKGEKVTSREIMKALGFVYNRKHRDFIAEARKLAALS